VPSCLKERGRPLLEAFTGRGRGSTVSTAKPKPTACKLSRAVVGAADAGLPRGRAVGRDSRAKKIAKIQVKVLYDLTTQARLTRTRGPARENLSTYRLRAYIIL